MEGTKVYKIYEETLGGILSKLEPSMKSTDDVPVLI